MSEPAHQTGTTVPLFALGSSVHPSLHPRFLVQNTSANVSEAGEAGEESSLLGRASGDGDVGEPITRAEIDKILTGDHGDEESLDSRQEDALVGKGSGLKNWGRGRVTVFVEGSKLLICDEEGECHDLAWITVLIVNRKRFNTPHQSLITMHQVDDQTEL